MEEAKIQYFIEPEREIWRIHLRNMYIVIGLVRENSPLPRCKLGAMVLLSVLFNYLRTFSMTSGKATTRCCEAEINFWKSLGRLRYDSFIP